jgi:hypothetical protein
MHRLEDMRGYEYERGYGRWGDLPMALRVYEVDENGTPRNLVRIELRSAEATPVICPYRCECGDEFGSWGEAMGHIEFDQAVLE